MNFPFKITLYRTGLKSTLYTIQFENEKETEFDKFLKDKKLKSSSHFQKLLVRIDDIAERLGCQDQFFKLEESSYFDNVVALSRGDLRLYCIRFGNVILILGSGGIKKTRTTQEDPKLDKIVNQMGYVAKRIDQKIRDKEIKIKDNKFVGDLNFE